MAACLAPDGSCPAEDFPAGRTCAFSPGAQPAKRAPATTRAPVAITMTNVLRIELSTQYLDWQPELRRPVGLSSFRRSAWTSSGITVCGIAILARLLNNMVA